MRRAAFLLTAIVSSSCIHIAPRPLAPSESAKQLESRSLRDSALQQFVAAHSALQAPITRWDLDGLTLAAFYFHPDLDIARAEAAVARAAILTAGERPNPSGTLSIEHKGEPGKSPWIRIFSFDATIETAGKRGLRVRRAEDSARAADLAIARTAWQIRSAIRAQLVALTTASESAAILRRQREAQNDLVEALQKRFELGEGSRVELTTARIAARQTELLLRDREAQLAQARARLAAAIGVPEAGTNDAEIMFDVQQLAPADAISAEMRERALLSRSDILALLADYAAAESALRLELARQYPDLHIAPGLGWDQGNRRWDFGFASLLPILSRNRGPIAEAEGRRSATESRFVALQARVIAATDEASELYRRAIEKLNAAGTVVTMQSGQVESTRRAFHAGEIDRVALRTAELELESARVAQADALAQAQQALGALEDAIEQPLTGGALPSVPRQNPRESQR